MRSLLGTRGKTQGRVYHSIKEEGERLRALYQKSAVFRPFHPLFLHHSAHAFFLMSPRPGHSRLDRPTPSSLRSCHVWSGFDALWLFYSKTLWQSLGNKGETGKWGETLDSHTYLNWRFFSKLKKGSQLFPGSLRRFLFLNWLNWQRRSCSLSSGSGANKSFSYFL